MKTCEWTIKSGALSKGFEIPCGKPATRAANIKGDGVYRPVCEDHYQLNKKLKQK
jgi:hypothetical protein